MAKHAARRITEPDGTTSGWIYRDTVIDKFRSSVIPLIWVYAIGGFGPDGITEHPTLAAAKRYIDQIKDA